MAAQVGHQMKLFVNGGTNAAPVWAEIGDVVDVSLPDLSMGLAELKRRSSGFTKNVATLIQSISIEFRLVYGLDSTQYNAIRTQFFNGEVREYAIMSGNINGSGNEGLRMPALVEQFPWDQPLEDISGHDVRLAVAYDEEGGSEYDPEWFTIAAP